MKKEKLYEILLAITGGLTFSIGMCMYSVKYWNLKYVGLATILVGVVLLLLMIPFHRKANVGIIKQDLNPKEKKYLKIGFLGLIAFIIGFILMFGSNYYKTGLVIATLGFTVDILLYPIYNCKAVIKRFKEIIRDKKTYKNLLMIIGSILFAIGMPLTAVEKFGMIIPGTIIGLIGLALIIIKLYLDGKEEKKKEFYLIDIRSIIAVALGVIGAFLIGYGLIRLTAFKEDNRIDLYLGIILNCIGFLLCFLPIPIYSYLKSNNYFNKILKIDIKDKNYSYPIKNLWLMFVIYGFLGWCVEFIVCGAFRGNFINRGFLHITLLPVWGFGGIVVTLIFSKSQRFVFTKSTLYLSFLEYMTSIFLEIFFNNKWWDYTHEPFNLNGRICLMNCLAFGIFGFIFSKYVSPFINERFNKSNKKIINCAFVFTLIVFCIDLLISIFSPNMGTGITS